MKRMEWVCLVACASLFHHNLSAQDNLNIQFGKITPADFDLSGQKFDSGANAVIIADIGKTFFEDKAGMTMVFTRFMRVKILNKNGFDIANERIYLRDDRQGGVEKISDLKGITYNLENGVVVETKLDEKSVFSERYTRSYDVHKFTLPSLKEGSIFDVSYSIKSIFFSNLRSWDFQGEYPVLWSEYETTIPPILHYVDKVQGDNQFEISTTKEVSQQFTVLVRNRFINLPGNAIQQRWVKKNVPALKEEAYTTTLNNYISKVSFQLHYLQWSSETERIDFLSTWPMVAKKMMNEEDFGLTLTDDNAWMTRDVNANTAGCTSDEEKIKKIYSFVRDNFSCTSHQGIWATSSLKEVYKKRGGTTAEINLLLTAMLRQANIIADPVILSTRSNGFADALYPLMEDYNYVICVAYAGNKTFRLDASQPYNGFRHLVTDCYNGGARIINQDKPFLIDLSPDSLIESNITTVFIANDDKGNSSGSYQAILGNDGSYDLRKVVKNSSPSEYFKKIQARYGTDISISNTGIDSLSSYEFPATVHYDFDLKNLLSGEEIYFNPMLAGMYKNNPFTSAERRYPVEMPFKIEDVYVLSMDIPKGYEVDELPKSARVAYNGNDGIFEYVIQKSADNIQMRVYLKLNKTFFPTEEYTALRDFFGYVVKKENEQIVFKKIH